MCGKKTTWSESNGNCGLDLCEACFNQATMDNEHYDGLHSAPEGARNPACRFCTGAAKPAYTEQPAPAAVKPDTDLSWLPNGGEQFADDLALRSALDLIKQHITADETAQNRDLHKAIGLIVDVARRHGLLGGAR